jgi:hypothetical protein
VLERALGIHLADWEYLRHCVVEQLPRRSVTHVSEPVGPRDIYNSPAHLRTLKSELGFGV